MNRRLLCATGALAVALTGPIQPVGAQVLGPIDYTGCAQFAVGPACFTMTAELTGTVAWYNLHVFNVALTSFTPADPMATVRFDPEYLQGGRFLGLDVNSFAPYGDINQASFLTSLPYTFDVSFLQSVNCPYGDIARCGWNGDPYDVLAPGRAYVSRAGSVTFALPPTLTPEPSAMLLLATGLVGVGGLVRRRQLRHRH